MTTIKQKPILCGGLVCLDIVNVCAEYPKEDSDQRCLDQRWQRGGNASNNCSVLSELGVPCEFFGTLAKGHELGFILNDFKDYGICIDNCIYHENCDVPSSSIIINAQNGSRTIVHSNKNLPELTLQDFQTLDLKKYGWIHFEVRNVDVLLSILEYLSEWNKQQTDKIPVSLEIEKTRPELRKFAKFADVVFVSKEHAIFSGWSSMTETVEKMAELTKPGATVICAWGAEGAAARSSSGEIVQSPAFPPKEVVDTLGAGDTFIAATITAIAAGKGLKECISEGCRIAGAKVGLHGFKGLGKLCK